MKLSRIIFSTEAPGLISGSSALTERQLAEQDEVMSVALAQPHRAGSDYRPDQPWRSTALGRFCLVWWHDDDARWEHWTAGENYAQLIDANRIAWGLKPREHGQAQPSGALTMDEMRERRDDTAHALEEARSVLRQVARSAPDLVKQLAWGDDPIPDRMGQFVYRGLHELCRYFEAGRRSRAKGA